ncbi:SDR family NAD(P)-dependent oxidoreductase, partial [Nocardiopsis tropica]|nr:SDR family NAD(P)-dependent oxidoreductase [Nocardiopsis tropica]
MTFSPPSSPARPVALVTGVGRTVGIGSAIARRLASSGWDVAFTHWTPYDARMDRGVEAGAARATLDALAERVAAAHYVEADLADPASPARIFDEAEERLGPVTALV